MHKGKFITFEGCDGSGKTTQARMLCFYLISNDISYVYMKENGINKFSTLDEIDKIRYGYLDRIQKYIKDGIWVILDRFIDSTVCYNINDNPRSKVVQDYYKLQYIPDKTFFINVKTDIIMNRLKKRNDNDAHEQLEFYKTISDKYNILAELYQDRIITIDGNSDNKKIIHQNIVNELNYHYGLLIKKLNAEHIFFMEELNNMYK